MKILADQNIPCVADAFRELGHVQLMPGREMKAEHLQDCQCLITRTVTRVDRALLQHSPVEFVGTATIGTDHFDLDYLREANIAHSNAAGCNAEGAAEYVISGLFEMARQRGFDPFMLKAGIIGCGNVGSRLLQKLETLGIDCLVCDPPLQRSGKSSQAFVSLETILGECNFISLHVPLTQDGPDPTFHLLDNHRLQSLVQGCVLVNAARGEVVDNAALLQLLNKRADLCVYLDTWESEPLVNRDLLRRVDLATPHIAGYSVEGRLRGTQMVLDAACEHFNVISSWKMEDQLPPVAEIDCSALGSDGEFWQNLFRQHCNIRSDHENFVAGGDLGNNQFATHFDGLRRVYPERLEYPHFRLRNLPADADRLRLRQLGFQLETGAS